MRHGILFRPDDGAGAGGGPAPAEGGTPAPPEGQQTPPPAKIEFTKEQQAHIDALITERVKRAEAAAEKRAKEAADEAARRAQMDETERLKAEKADAEKRISETQAAANARIVKAEAKLAAVAAGVRPERVDAALRLIDLTAIDVNSDGEPDQAAIALAFSNLKTDLPELFGVSGPVPRSGADFQGGNQAPRRIYTEADIEAMSTEEFSKVQDDVLAAVREGRVVASE